MPKALKNLEGNRRWHVLIPHALPPPFLWQQPENAKHLDQQWCRQGLRSWGGASRQRLDFPVGHSARERFWQSFLTNLTPPTPLPPEALQLTPFYRLRFAHAGLTHNDIFLAQVGLEALTSSDAEALWAAAVPVLQDFGIRVNSLSLDSKTWLQSREITADWLSTLKLWDLDCALGHSLRDCAPAGENAAQWRRCLNALQMTWHDHPVNKTREAAGLPVVNAVWLDQAKRLPPALTVALQHWQIAAPLPDTMVFDPDTTWPIRQPALHDTASLKALCTDALSCPFSDLPPASGFIVQLDSLTPFALAKNWAAWLSNWQTLWETLALFQSIPQVTLHLLGEQTRLTLTRDQPCSWWARQGGLSFFKGSTSALADWRNDFRDIPVE